ncbi:hypothetical protein [Flavobacterium sp.]|uniref:hypothetical protein n=1 Tax=Flavobacterium sp. TaxID=239 RepID=UPI003753C4C2
MDNNQLNNLKIELLKIEINCLKLLSEKLSKSSYMSDIENIANKSNTLKKEIDSLLISSLIND